MDLRRLKTGIDECLGLIARLGISVDAIERAEDFDRLALVEESFPVDRLQTLSADGLNSLASTFGPALRLVVRVGDYEHLKVSGSCAPKEFENFRRGIRGVPDVTFEVLVDKSKFCQLCQCDEPGKRVRFFFSRGRLARLLERSLGDPTELESTLWGSSLTDRVVLLSPGQNMRLLGPFLAVLSGSCIEEAPALPPVAAHEVERAKAIYLACKAAVRWERSLTSCLVPRCFRIEGHFASSDPIVRAVLAHWANLSVAFTADRVQQVDGRLVASYATDRMRCEIELLTDTKDLSFAFCNNAHALGDIAEWAYDEKWGSDRLRMVQIGIARAMAYAEQPRTCSSLVVQSPGIREELEWLWKTFICDEIERFSEEERKLEDEVARTVAAFDGEVAEMIKSLSATVLAAVGILIGSVIAAAFKGDFNATVFSLGIWAYVAYVVVFPGIYNMTHHVLRFRTFKGLFSNRLERFKRALAPDVVENVVGKAVSAAQVRFWIWLGCTIVAFVVVVGACLWARTGVPELLQKNPASPPAAQAKPLPATSAAPSAGAPLTTGTTKP